MVIPLLMSWQLFSSVPHLEISAVSVLEVSAAFVLEVSAVSVVSVLVVSVVAVLADVPVGLVEPAADVVAVVFAVVERQLVDYSVGHLAD